MKTSTKISGPEEFGRRIRRERKALELTQQEISEYTDVGRKFVIELEKGKETAQIGKIFQVIEGLGLELHIVRRGEG